jgi:hypothetical protein
VLLLHKRSLHKQVANLGRKKGPPGSPDEPMSVTIDAMLPADHGAAYRKTYTPNNAKSPGDLPGLRLTQ